jgi:hypothetical protein
VDVSQTLFETYHRLAVGSEPKMSRFDDAGMHRADWDLMEGRPLRRQKGMARTRGFARRVVAQRILDSPVAVIQPRPRIGMAGRGDPIKIVNYSLESQGWRMRGSQCRKPPIVHSQAEHRYVADGLRSDSYVDGFAIAPLADQR